MDKKVNNVQELMKNLKDMGYEVSYFDTAKEAAEYLDGKIDGKTVASGGSVTVQQLGLEEMLKTHNEFIWHWKSDPLEIAANADVYLSSANAITKAGEIVNIDGTGNRVASTIFGHKELYFIIGINKICEDLESAIWRARNIAAPINAKRLKRNTPCAERADKCYNCDSPERICRVLSVHWKKPRGTPYQEVVIVGEELGF
ncbi:MAG: LUD domain-containing protein [Clostridiales bacterium]|nr:LUD domain-containing protein [Clostridiales bacterium]